jgi:hypothetical protein
MDLSLGPLYCQQQRSIAARVDKERVADRRRPWRQMVGAPAAAEMH